MSKGFNWTKIAKQDQMRKNGTQEMEAMADALLGKSKKTKFGLVRSRPKEPVVFEWDPPR